MFTCAGCCALRDLNQVHGRNKSNNIYLAASQWKVLDEHVGTRYVRVRIQYQSSCIRRELRFRTFNHCVDNEYSAVAEFTNLTAESGTLGSVLSSLATRTLNTVGALVQVGSVFPSWLQELWAQRYGSWYVGGRCSRLSVIPPGCRKPHYRICAVG